MPGRHDPMSAKGHSLLRFSPIIGKPYLVQRPSRVTGNRKVRIESEVRDILGGGPDVGGGLDLAQALAHEEDAVD